MLKSNGFTKSADAVDFGIGNSGVADVIEVLVLEGA